MAFSIDEVHGREVVIVIKSKGMYMEISRNATLVVDRTYHIALHASLHKPYRADPYSLHPPIPPPIEFADGSVEYEENYIVRSRQRRTTSFPNEMERL